MYESLTEMQVHRVGTEDGIVTVYQPPLRLATGAAAGGSGGGRGKAGGAPQVRPGADDRACAVARLDLLDALAGAVNGAHYLR